VVVTSQLVRKILCQWRQKIVRMILSKNFPFILIWIFLSLPSISSLGISTLFGTDYLGSNFIFHTRPERGFLNRVLEEGEEVVENKRNAGENSEEVWEDNNMESQILQDTYNEPARSHRSLFKQKSKPFGGLWKYLKNRFSSILSKR